MNAIDICIYDTQVTKDYMSASKILPLIEAQCEASLLRNAINPTEDILRAFFCRENCSGHGQCLDLQGCQCHPGFSGYFCQFEISIQSEVQYQICDLNFEPCLEFYAQGQFLPEGLCKIGENEVPYDYISENEVKCILDDAQVGQFEINIGNTTTLNVQIFDSNCTKCEILGKIECTEKAKICRLNGTCHMENSLHSGDQCLHCVDGSWLKKSDGYISSATSELVSEAH